MVKFSKSVAEQTENNETKNREKRGVEARQLALLMGALFLSLYLRTLAPGLLAGDPGEFQVAAWTLGIAHPTGYPLYLSLGYLWQHGLALVGVSPATALNAFSAVCSAIAVCGFFLLQLRWLAGHRPLATAAAVVSAAFFGLNPTFWNQSLIAEVYSLHMLFVVLSMFAYQQYYQGYSAEKGHRWFWMLCVLAGLSLTHHAMSIWLLAGIGAGLAWLWWGTARQDEASAANQGISIAFLLTGLIAALLPLLLYFYIPLRSGPEASPWYHQRLGEDALVLYESSAAGFWRFISGESISIGFRSVADALSQVGFALDQYRIHLTWLGILLALIGIYTLWEQRKWRVLLPTGLFFILQQGFNLFYAIGDIYVYYIPLYWICALWIGFGCTAIGGWTIATIERIREGRLQQAAGSQRKAARTSQRKLANWHEGTAVNASAALIIFVALIPLSLARTYFDQIDQSDNQGTRLRWEEILAADPPDDAILVSNDRNEIVPLFYFQHVEGRAGGMTGLFPLIAPDERFSDIGSTLTTALTEGGEQPVVLIKPMPGLEARFQLVEQNPPLVEVVDSYDEAAPPFVQNVDYGPLTLLGYDWQETATDERQVEIALTWQINAPIDGDYTTSIQLFDAAGEKIGQDDRRAGGDYYPTNLWKPGETVRDYHLVNMDADAEPASILIVLYTGDDFAQLAPPLEVKLE